MLAEALLWLAARSSPSTSTISDQVTAGIRPGVKRHD
jgi:hypothetical protein